MYIMWKRIHSFGVRASGPVDVSLATRVSWSSSGVARGLAGAGSAHRAGTMGSVPAALTRLSSRHAVIKRNVMRKIKRGIDRLPSQGPDPAMSSLTPNGWRIAAAAVLERYPVVIPEPHPFEAKYLEGRFLWEQSISRPIPEAWFESDRPEAELDTKSPDDLRAEMYEPAPIITEADKTNDLRSLDRALRERLYFVIRRTSGSPNFQFPQTLATSPQVSMRGHAELALKSVLPSGVRTYFISNMPATHLAHVYAPDYQRSTGYFGVKVFFYRAQLITGEMPPEGHALPGGVDYAWAREEELPNILSAETFRAVVPLMFGVGDKVDLSIEYEEPASTANG